MSFLSILKGIIPVLGRVENVAAPIAEMLMPGEAPLIAVFDGWVHRAQTSIAAVEAGSPTASPEAKLAATVSDFEAGLQMTQSILAMTGLTVTYDKKALQDAISAQVTAFNAFAKVKASLVPTKIAPA